MQGLPAFILTAESRDVKGKCELLFYCITDEGPALAVIRNSKPLFFIKNNTPEVLTASVERKALDLTDFSGNPADALYFPSIDQYFITKRYLKENNVTLYESDIKAEDRYLMERFINTSVVITGPAGETGKYSALYRSCS